MKKKEFTENEIAEIFRERKAGASVQDICARYHITPAIFYRWRAKHSDLCDVRSIAQFRALDAENKRLKKLEQEHRYLKTLEVDYQRLKSLEYECRRLRALEMEHFRVIQLRSENSLLEELTKENRHLKELYARTSVKWPASE